MKKKKQNPIEHEEQYINYLEKQIDFHKKQNSLDKVEELKRKLSKARLVLKLLKSK